MPKFKISSGNRKELINDFMRIQVSREVTVLEVAIVSWDCQEPYLEWKIFCTWQGIPTASEVGAAKQQALLDKDFFGRCSRCGRLCNSGHMHNDNTCQGCAERYLGIVH